MIPSATAPASLPSRGLGRLVAWPRVKFVLITSAVFGVLISFSSATTPIPVWVARTGLVVSIAVLMFGLFEQWPRRLPSWLARWVLQLLGVVVTVPIATFTAYLITTGGDWYFWRDHLRLTGFSIILFNGILFGPWMAFIAMVRQRDQLAREQALSFQLERSELERQALDARMRLLQAQVQPHFLFNTLANVRALVRAGSPQASAVVDSLIAYLRAAVPRLNETSSTLGHEIGLVRAYLELMHMRMPDRLQFTLHADEAAVGLRCPPMTLLTLVENAVRHGIDPSEEGGRIEVSVILREGRCIARVIDTGAGLGQASQSLGTGLSTLRERLQLAFGGDAQLRLSGLTPHGVCAEIEFPAQKAST
jgi:hypothetical protein